MQLIATKVKPTGMSDEFASSLTSERTDFQALDLKPNAIHTILLYSHSVTFNSRQESHTVAATLNAPVRCLGAPSSATGKRRYNLHQI